MECEVFPLVCVGDVEGLGGAVLLGAEVELLHVLLGGANTDEGTQLGPCNNQLLHTYFLPPSNVTFRLVTSK